MSLLTHDHFEQLCAAAITGQTTRAEVAELQEHMETCADCRDFVGDVRQVVGPALLEHGGARSTDRLPKGARERFIATAHSEGIPLGRKGPSQVRRSRYKGGIVLFAVVAFIALLGVLLYLKFLAGDRHPPATTGKAIEQRTIPVENKQADELLRERAELQQQVQYLRLQLRSLESKVASSHDALKEADRRRSEMTARVNALDNTTVELHNTVQDRDAQIKQLRDNVDRLALVKQANETAIQTEEAELNSLRDRVASLSTRLEESEHLSRAANQAKDLIVARNLHIVDVNEADENGKQQKPFGRIFYTEGKKLVFYAYDLADSRQLEAKIHFYVWGEKLGANRPIRTLGVFHDDNKNEGRWVLTFDDQQVLAQIDSVFVTAETDKRPATQPGGRKILYAYLGAKANHP